MSENDIKKTKEILQSLKDFQLETVDYVFKRFYSDHDKVRRFLVADEVGLGKTMVAKGLIAKAVDHLTFEKPNQRIDIIYICSNLDIADQNISRLDISRYEEIDDAVSDDYTAGRITLLPLELHKLEEKHINFVSFTPGTSFDIKRNMGLAQERLLLHELVVRAWGALKGSTELFAGHSDHSNFKSNLKGFETEYKDKLEEGLSKKFINLIKDDNDLKKRFTILCKDFCGDREKIKIPSKEGQRRFIGDLRELLAETCINSLEPALVILDEFQRFKHLLNEEDEDSKLARKLFQFKEAKVLLLSATPYKMYTMSNEAEGEDHYADFLKTTQFLFGENQKSQEVLANVLEEYRENLNDKRSESLPALVLLSRKLEFLLNKIMCRTERLAVSSDRNGMLKDCPNNMELLPKEIEDYVQLSAISSEISNLDVIEYWKAAPYLLNFLDGYKFKEEIQDVLNGKEGRSIKEIIAKHPRLVLEREEIESYKSIELGNARLREFMKDSLKDNLWNLLWIPPAMPYYEMGGIYSDDKFKKITKRLVFSAWRVVPRAVSSIVNYETERCIFKAYDEKALNTKTARERRSELLSITVGEGGEKLRSKNQFLLLYPSWALAQSMDPKGLQGDGVKFTYEQTLQHAIDVLTPKIEKLVKKYGGDFDREDVNWYWAVGMLMDYAEHNDHLKNWINQEDLAAIWSSEEGSEESTRWGDHVEYLIEKFGTEKCTLPLGYPPKDLVIRIAEAVLGSPAIVTLRGLLRIFGSGNEDSIVSSNAAAQIGWAFRRYFNTPEATAIIREKKNNEVPYWALVNRYCAQGCLQSVVDEYFHILKDSMGLRGKKYEKALSNLAEEVIEALSVRAANYQVGEISRKGDWTKGHIGFRTRFAVGFSKEGTGDDEKTLVRSSSIRSAFNSPFWPFFLFTTSVGQEGLDFHPYCHAIVHWNLPNNPVDFEQREGRIHRFKGHAVRKNVAKKYEKMVLTNSPGDPWDMAFDFAVIERGENENDLVPYWVYSIPEGAKIERHVMAYPFSRDSNRYLQLCKTLSVYRMVFGQPRQDDLVKWLMEFPQVILDSYINTLKVDLSPPKNSK